MRRICVPMFFLFAVVAFGPAALRAQYPKEHRDASATLDGQVVGEKGKPVAGARVQWQSADGRGKPHALRTDAQGHFRVAPLRPGLYDLHATSGKASSEWSHNVLVRPGSEVNVTLRLAVASARVAATPPAVELAGTMRTWDVPVADALPHDPAVDPSGNIWFTLQHAGQLARFSPTTQEWKLYTPPTPKSGPHGLVADAAGNIWFTENYVGQIGRLDPDTASFTEYAAPTAKDPHTPVFGPDGALWFTAQRSNLIGRLDVATGKITEFSVPTQDAHPYGIVSGPDGALWFCEVTGRKLGRMEPKTGTITEFAPAESDAHPRRLAVVGNAIYFTDFGGRLGRFTIADQKFQLWNSPSGDASAPYGIAADSTGKIWYQESGKTANKLVRFDPAQQKFQVFSMPAENASVRHMALDAHGRLWMPLSSANKIAVVD